MPSPLLESFAESCARFQRLPAYAQLGSSLTYGDLEAQSRRIAAWFQLQGLPEGARIALQLPNSLLYPALVWGVLRAGLTLVNINPQYTARETRKILRDAEVSVWFASEMCAPLVDELEHELANVRIVLCDLFALHFWPRRLAFNFLARSRKSLPRRPRTARVEALGPVLRCRAAWHEPELDGASLAVLQYTGGSTGELMGAMLSHANLLANSHQVKAMLGTSIEDGKELLLAPLPLYHIFSFTVHCAVSLLTGAQNLLIMDASQIGSVLREMQRQPPTIMTGVNTLFYALMRLGGFKTARFPRLKFAIAGGMKLDPEVGLRWQELTGTPILEGFGMSELSPVASWNPPDGNRLGTIGKAVPDTEMELRDSNGQKLLDPRLEGELWVRGPQVMQGYWRKPEATAYHLDAQGFMRTGDLARCDEDGYWRITGRSKRMILVSGFNVYPSEVEEVLRQHPAIADAHVFGQAHPVNGELVKAQIVLREGPLLATDVRDHCKRHLAGYKIPRQIEFVPNLKA